jgi:hypothetical protein
MLLSCTAISCQWLGTLRGTGGDDGGGNDDGSGNGVEIPPPLDGLAYLELRYEGWDGFAPEAYTTEVFLRDSETAFDISQGIYFALHDASDSEAVEAGTYSLNDSATVGNATAVELIAGRRGLTATLGYAASNVPLETYRSRNPGFEIQHYDRIESATITVSRQDERYSFIWELESADGDIITGSYSGTVNAGSLRVSAVPLVTLRRTTRVPGEGRADSAPDALRTE